VIGLRPRHRVAFPIAGHRQRVDRIHRPPRRPQRRDQQAAWGFDRDRDRGLGAITGSPNHFDELGEPAGVVGDAFLGDQLPVAVDDRDVVLGLGPVDPAEQFHVRFPSNLFAVCALVTSPAGRAALYLRGSMAFPPMSCSRSQRPARRRSMLRAPRLEKTETFLHAGGLQRRHQSHPPATVPPPRDTHEPAMTRRVIPNRVFARARPQLANGRQSPEPCRSVTRPQRSDKPRRSAPGLTAVRN
jgi:hypothetical protein